MNKLNKKQKEAVKIIDLQRKYPLEEAIIKLQECPKAKFDESVDISLKLGIDPKKSDQQIRSTVTLPHGTGKKTVIAVFAKGQQLEEAEKAGADFVGSDDLIQKVKDGWTEFDAVVATPDMMKEVGKLGKVLGPRGLMPTPKAGTVTTDVMRAITELKSGKIEFRTDKTAGVNNAIGKISFSKEAISENIKTFLQAIIRAKPANAKGEYIQRLVLSSTMGPGIKIDIQSAI
ncbi:MAG: 50S ribosomal protein L1 [Chlamydiales bacterium]